MKIGISVLNSFSYRRASEDVSQFYKEGSIFYVELEDAEQKAELLYLLSNNFPHRNKISIEFSPALLQVLALSEIQGLDEFPSNPSGRTIIFWHTGLKKLYLYSGTRWIDLSTYKEGSEEAIQVSPALFGDIITDGLTNEASIGLNVIKDENIASTAAIKLSKLEVNPLSRANHSGTQSYTTISDFKAGVESVRLDELETPIRPLSVGSQRITDLEKGINPKDAVNLVQMTESLDDLSLSDLSSPESSISFANYALTYLADPSNEQDGVNLRSLEKRVTGLSFKEPVRVVDTSTMPYPRAGSVTIDGITVLPGQRVLRASANTQAKNGIWEVQLGTWTRAADAKDNAQLKSGLVVNVQEGTNNKDSQWMLTSPDGPVVLETSSLVFKRKDGIEALNYNTTLVNTSGSLGVKHNPQHITNGLAGLEIATAYPGGEGITTLGTIETGVWEGSTLEVAYGGTGANNAADARANLQAADLVAGTSLGIERLPNLSQPITLAQGGTGFVATEPKEILDFVGGIGGAKNAPGGGSSLIKAITNPTATDPKELHLKTLIQGSGIVLQDNGNNIIISGQVLPGQSVENAGLGTIELVTAGPNGKLIKELTPATGITITNDVDNGVVIGLDSANLGLDINTLSGGALSTTNGGLGDSYTDINSFLTDFNILTGLADQSGDLPANNYSIIGNSDITVQDGVVVNIKSLEAGNNIEITDTGDSLVIDAVVSGGGSNPVKMFVSDVLNSNSTSAPFEIDVVHNLFTDPNANGRAVQIQVVNINNVPVTIDAPCWFGYNSTTIAFTSNPGPVRVSVIAYDADPGWAN
jgi:hypothetical protein